MTAFIKKMFAIMMSMATLLQCSAAFAAPGDFAPENIFSKRAESRFGRDKADSTDFDPYQYSLEGVTIGIDPGHQLEADSEQEPISPEDDEKTKDRMSPGGTGIRSGIAEYSINLIVAEKLSVLLQNRGATVVMTRSTHDVNLSNIERAQLMNEAQVDFWIRIHCNSSNYQSISGALIIAPGIDMEIYDSSAELGKQVLTGFCTVTGAKCCGISYTATQTGFNWSDSPVVTIEMGYLSNPKEDGLLSRESYQNKCAEGIFTGIAAYCAAKEEKK